MEVEYTEVCRGNVDLVVWRLSILRYVEGNLIKVRFMTD